MLELHKMSKKKKKMLLADERYAPNTFPIHWTGQMEKFVFIFQSDSF